MKRTFITTMFFLALGAGVAAAQEPPTGGEGTTDETTPPPDGPDLTPGPAPETTPPPAAQADDAGGLRLGDQGHLEIHGLLQVWFIQSFDDNEHDGGGPKTNFRIRRTEIKLAGRIIPKVEFEVQVDPSRSLDGNETNRAILQDASITFGHLDKAKITLGQGHTPISFEGLRSASKLLFIERAIVSGTFGDQRDIGVWAHEKIGKIGYVIGIFNGSGASKPDPLKDLDLAARLELHASDDLQISGSVLRTLNGDKPGVHTIAGGDVAYEHGGTIAQAEFYWGKFNSFDAMPVAVTSMGAYAAAGYTFTQIAGHDLQGAARFDWFDPNTDADKDQIIKGTGGLNLFLDGHHAKLQLNFTHTQRKADNGMGTLVDANNNVVLLNGQIAF
ncbi:MAG TPA: porin [Kofleriaceae bacterium]|nr:porin [Kofleriaceae bacterium]